jgi:cellulose synthase/poly-beta-1,6-N-acetylglucosamine synthase-like glycosyltransferase
MSMNSRAGHALRPGRVLLLGLGLVALWNWRQWRRDRTLNRQRREQKPTPVELNATLRVSVLVAAWNEADLIQQHVESFLALRYPDKELVLCAGGQDGTYELSRCYMSTLVRVLEQRPGEGKQRALRRCLEQATGAVIYLTDGDCLFSDETFERTLAPVINREAAASTGRSRPLSRQLDSAFVAYQWTADEYEALRAPATSPGLLGRNCAIRAEALETIGAFEHVAPTGTDYLLARQLLRSGYSIVHVRSSAVETRYPASLSAYFRQRSRWLGNLIVIGLKTGDVRQAYYGLRSAALGTGILLMPLLAFAFGPVVLALWFVALGHGVLARIRYVSLHEFPGDVPKYKIAAAGILTLAVDLLGWGSAWARCLLSSWRYRWG